MWAKEWARSRPTSGPEAGQLDATARWRLIAPPALSALPSLARPSRFKLSPSLP